MVVAALGVVVALAPAASKLTLTASAAFIHGQVDDGLTIEVENSGQDAKGSVTINAGGGKTVYPIELPRGAHKQFVGYPLSSPENRWEPITCDLDTDRGSVHIDVPSSYSGESQGETLEISDELGGLQFLDEKSSGPTPPRPGFPSTRSSVYVKPEDAPGRLVAYRRLQTVVLGPGAERIPDTAVQALKEYLVSGGKIIFVGGSGAPTYRDRRWADLIPLAGVHAETRTVTLTAAGSHFSMPLDVQAGTPTLGSHLLPGDVVTQPVGLGLVVAIPFDLLQGPMKAWAGRPKFLTSLVQIPTGGQLVWPDDTQNGSGYYPPGAPRPYTGAPSAYTSSTYRPYPGAGRESDPFSFEPPKPMSVFWIVFCYLIVVAPVNFFVLRKLRRSEWAWFTTPCISIVFAGFLLKLASGLYSGRMMTAAQGTLVISEHPSTGIFRGSSQLFFPIGGSYDLKLSGVDWMAANDNQGYGARSTSTAPVTALDTDQLSVPDLAVRNLQFRELDYEQLVDTAGWFTFSAHRNGTMVVVTISNHSPYSLNAGSIAAEGAIGPVLQLAPGASSTVSMAPLPATPGSEQLLSSYSKLIHRPILSGTLTGFRPGPQVGDEAPGRPGIGLVAVGAEPTGGKP